MWSVFVIPIVAIVCTFLFLALVVVVRLITTIINSRDRKGQAGDGAESQIVQDIFQQMERAEKRIEALEAILIEQSKKNNDGN